MLTPASCLLFLSFLISAVTPSYVSKSSYQQQAHHSQQPQAHHSQQPQAHHSARSSYQQPQAHHSASSSYRQPQAHHSARRCSISPTTKCKEITKPHVEYKTDRKC